MKAVWVDLPDRNMVLANRDRLKFIPRGQFGVIEVFHESTEETPGTQTLTQKKIAEIAPAGKVWGAELGDFLAEHYSFSGHNGKASLAVATKRVDIEASLVPCVIFGFIELPQWLLASIKLTVYIDGALALRHTFW